MFLHNLVTILNIYKLRNAPLLIGSDHYSQCQYLVITNISREESVTMRKDLQNFEQYMSSSLR